MKTKKLPDVQRVREILSYSSETGKLTWIVRRGGVVNAGDIAGTLDWRGYLRVRIDGADYRAHRLAWLLHYGCAPDGEIDHINRDKTDNRSANIRLVSRSVNVLNRGKQKNNTSGVTGVNWRKDVSKWTASISVGKKSQHLGYFDSVEDAKKARRVAELRIRGEVAG